MKRKDDFDDVGDEPPTKRQRRSGSNSNSSTHSPSEPKLFDYVIIGGGVAGGYALHEFYGLKKEESKSNNEETLCLISSETEYPYERPALTKGFLLKPNKVDLPMFHTCAFIKEMHDERWYLTEALSNGISVKLNTRVTDIDFTNKIVTASSKDTNETTKIRYNKLLLATGAEARKLGGETYGNVGNILYLRNYQDAVLLRENIINGSNGSEEKEKEKEKDNQANANKKVTKVVMIGGGYIGMEIVSALLSVFGSGMGKNKIELIVTFPEKYFMQISVFKNKKCQELGEYYMNKFVHFKNDNVSIKFVNGGFDKHFVTSFDVNKEEIEIAKSVKLADGTVIEGDYFVVGIGARLNDELYIKPQTKDLLKFDARHGIPVDCQLRTNVKDVYGCGDCISYHCKFSNNKNARYEHVRHARASAMYAMRQMACKRDGDDLKKEYTFLPQFYSRIFDCHWEFYGDFCLNDKDCDIHFIADNGNKINENTKQIIGIWSKKGNICGVFIETGQKDEKANWKRELMKQLVNEHRSVGVLGKWHPLNKENDDKSNQDEKSKDSNDKNTQSNVDLLVEHIKKQIVPTRLLEKHVTKESKL